MGAAASSSSSVLAEAEWELSEWRFDSRLGSGVSTSLSFLTEKSEEGIVGPQSQIESTSTTMGISLTGFLRLAQTIKAAFPSDSSLTTRHVVEEWIADNSITRGKSFAACDDLVDPQDLGPPSFFISHSWDASFDLLVNTIESFLTHHRSNSKSKDNSSSIHIWIDLVSVQLEPTDDRHFTLRLEETRAAIEASSCGTLVVIDPSSMPFSQAWCLLEMDLTIRTQGPDSLHLPLLSHGPTSSPDPLLLHKVIDSIDLATAMAPSNPEHLEGIKLEAKRNHGSIAAFSASLRLALLVRPLSQHSDLSRHLTLSQLISWRFDRVEEWLHDPFRNGRCLVISATSNEGRSSAAAAIWDKVLASGRPTSSSSSSCQVFSALHLVKKDDLRRMQPAQMIKSLAFQLASLSRLPGLLLPPPSLIHLFEDLEKDLEDLLIPILSNFSDHLAASSPSSPSPPPHQDSATVPPQVIVLLDGLEEAYEEEGAREGREGVCGLLRFLVHAISLLPFNVRFILTVNESKGASSHRVKLREILTSAFTTSSNVQDEQEAIDFLQLEELISDDPDRVTTGPKSYETAFGPSLNKKQAVVDLVNVLLAAFEPLSLTLLIHMGLGSHLSDLPSDVVITHDGGRVSFASTGMRDWLLAHAGSNENPFLSSLDVNAGHVLLALHLLDKELLPWLVSRPSYGSSPKVATAASEYSLKYIFRHICHPLTTSSSPDPSDGAFTAKYIHRKKEGLSRLEKALRSWELVEQVFLAGHGELGLIRPLSSLCLHSSPTAHHKGRPTPSAIGHYPRECLRWLQACKASFRKDLGSSTGYGSKGSGVIEVITIESCPPTSLKHREANGRLLALRGHTQPIGSLIHSHLLGEEGSDWPPLSLSFSSLLGLSEARCVAYSPSGNLLASCFRNGAIEVWSVLSRRCILRLIGGEEMAREDERGVVGGTMRVAFSPDGGILGSVGSKGLLLWDIASGACLLTLKGARALSFGPQGLIAACSMTEHSASVYYFSSPSQGIDHTSTIGWTEVPQGSVLLSGHRHYVKAISISPDGKVVATGSSDGSAKLWNLPPPSPPPQDGTKLIARSNLLGHGGWVSSIAFSPDSKMVATAGGLDGKIQVWFVISGTLSSTLFHREGAQHDSPPFSIPDSAPPPLMNGDVSCIAFGPSFGGSSLLVSAGDDGFVRLWNLNYCPKASIGEEPRAICFLTLPLSGPMHLPSPSPTFPDGSNALPSPFSSQTSSPSEMSHVTFSPCGRFIAAASVDGSVTEFDIEDHLRTYRLSSIATSHINGGGSNPVVDTDGGPAASISPWYESPSPGHQNWQPLSPRTSEVGSKTSTISPRVSMAGSKPLPNGGSCTAVDRLRVEALPGPDQHTKGVTALAFNPEPRFGPDGDRRASKKSSGGGHESILSAVTGGSFMATGSADCTCRLWHLDSARCVAVMAEHKDALTAVAWSPDCRYVATASLDSTALVYDVSYVIELCLKGQVQGVEVGGCKWIANLAGHEEAVTSLTWSPRGRGVLVTGSKDGTIKFWDVSKIGVGALCTVTLYEAHLHSQGGTTGLSYSRDGALLASVGTDRYLKVWDMTTDEILSVVKAPFEDEFVGVAFLDHKRVATCMRRAKDIKLWDTQSKQLVAVLGGQEGHRRGVMSIVLSPDGKLLGSTSQDMTAKVWSTTSWKCIETIEGSNDWVLCMDFASGGGGEGEGEEGGSQVVKAATGAKNTQVKLVTLNI